MKNWLKKLLGLAMAAGLTLSAVACGGGDESKSSDKTSTDTKGKTAIKLSYFIGEFGDEWLKEIAADWSKNNDSYYIDVKSNLNLGGTIVADIKSGSSFDMFITEDCSFQQLFSGDYLEDLSGLLSEKPEGKKTIGEKLVDKDGWLKAAGSGDKVYLLPYNISPCGLIFDYDRFAEKGWLITDKDGTVSAGKDGIKGTYDDGQPQTMAEFKAMCENIKGDGVDDVFLFMGANHPEYVNNVAYAYLASVIGEEGYKAFYTHDSNGKEIELADGTKTAVTIEDGYKTWLTKGVNDMTEFVQDYLANTKYVSEVTLSDKSLSVDASHTKFIEVTDAAPAFIIEGNWFENGSRALIESNVDYGGKPYGTSDYRYMILPTADGEKSQMFSQTGGSLLVTKQSDENKKAAIKDFVKYMLKDENLGKVTADTGMIWNYNYDISTESKAKMTKFTKNAYDMVQDEANVSVHSFYIDTAATPIYAYSSLGSAGLMLFGELQYSIIPAFTSAGSAAKLMENITKYNTAERWSGYLAQAKSYGFYKN